MNQANKHPSGSMPVLRRALFAMTILICSGLFIGCVGPRQQRPSLATASQNLRAKATSIVNETKNLQRQGYKAAKRGGGVAPADQQKIDSRAARYQELALAKAEAETSMGLIFKENSAKAERINTTRRWLGLSGIAAGVGAAALTVASPANAVWIAAFSGFAGSIAGLNLVMDNNGFSVALISQLENAAIEEASQIYNELSLSALASMVSDPTITEAAFIAEATKQEKLINRLKLLLLKLNVPAVKAPETPTPDSLSSNEINAL
jgi:hypothetical protein